MEILIVEDNDDGRENLIDILELDAHHVTGVATAIEAIESCEKSNFDTVIVDWNLTDGTADELIPKVQKLQPGKPIIVITGFGDMEVVVTAMRIGVWDYLEKPINYEVLRATIARISERKSNLDRLESVQKKLLESERLAAIGEMVAGLAHESRNAFQRSQACLEMLALNLEEDAENLQIVDRIQNALEQLQFLYEEVRNYAAPIILEKESVSLESLVKETWSLIEPERKCNDDLLFKNKSSIKSLSIDRSRIQQVLRNLLENAVDANRQTRGKEPGQLEIQVGVEDSMDGIRIEVSDQGPGVPEEKKSSIFEPFVTTKTKGTGLGLAISRRIVEAHGGTIGLSNESPTTFVFELPLSS